MLNRSRSVFSRTFTIAQIVRGDVRVSSVKWTGRAYWYLFDSARSPVTRAAELADIDVKRVRMRDVAPLLHIEDLLHTKNVGRKTAIEIYGTFADHGFAIDDEGLCRRARTHETPARVASRVRRDDENGLLPKFAGDDFRDTLGTLKDAPARAGDRRGGDFDDECVFGGALPDTARTPPREAGERATDETLHLVDERVGVERRGKAAVSAGRAGNAAADVEAHGAHGFEVSPSPEVPPPYRSLAAAHGASVTRDGQRDPTRATRASEPVGWLRFHVEDDSFVVETSWLPGELPPSCVALRSRCLPPEFKRHEDGSYVAHVRLDDDLAVERIAARALRAVLDELRKDDE